MHSPFRGWETPATHFPGKIVDYVLETRVGVCLRTGESHPWDLSLESHAFNKFKMATPLGFSAASNLNENIDFPSPRFVISTLSNLGV